MKIPQHLLRSLLLGLGAVSVTALPGCKTTAPPAPMSTPSVDCCAPPTPAKPVPVSAPGTCEVTEVGPSVRIEPDPIDPCPACGRG